MIPPSTELVVLGLAAILQAVQIGLAGWSMNRDGLSDWNAGPRDSEPQFSLLTSRFEGFGLVLLESLSHGCPVVSYDVKYGPADIVADGVNGFLVGSAMQQQMARRVVEVLTDEPLRRRLSEDAAQPRTEFSEETFVARWSELFHRLDAEGWGDDAERGADAG